MAEDKIVKPIVVPSGVKKPVTTSPTPVSVTPPKPIVVPTGSVKPATAIKAPKVPKSDPESEDENLIIEYVTDAPDSGSESANKSAKAPKKTDAA